MLTLVWPSISSDTITWGSLSEGGGASFYVIDVGAGDRIKDGQQVTANVSGDLGNVTGTVSIKDSGGGLSVSQPVVEWENTFGTSSHVTFDVTQEGLPFARDHVLEITTDDNRVATLDNLTLDPVSGNNYINTLPPASGPDTLANYTLSGTASSGQQIEWTDATAPSNIIVNPDWTAQGSEFTTFQFRAWDTDYTWSEWETVEVSAKGGLSTPVRSNTIRNLIHFLTNGATSKSYNVAAIEYYQAVGATSRQFNTAKKEAQELEGFLGDSPADYRNYI